MYSRVDEGGGFGMVDQERIRRLILLVLFGRVPRLCLVFGRGQSIGSMGGSRIRFVWLGRILARFVRQWRRKLIGLDEGYWDSLSSKLMQSLVCSNSELDG